MNPRAAGDKLQGRVRHRKKGMPRRPARPVTARREKIMAKSTRNPATPPEQVSAMSAAILAANPATAKMWLDIVNESARFVSERLREDLSTQTAMLRCKSPVELVQVQSEFIRKAVEQYTEESMRLFEIMREAAAEAGSVQSREYDDVPL